MSPIQKNSFFPGRGTFVGGWSLRDSDTDGDFLFIPDADGGFAFVRPNGDEIVIDRSFITDGATVPRPLRLTHWLDPYGSIRSAAFLHDYLWILRYTGEAKIGFFGSNRIMREACVLCGLTFFQRWLVWLAITLFGWIVWYWGSDRSRRSEAKKCLDKAQVMMLFAPKN